MKRKVYKVYFIACALFILTVIQSFAQTLDYSNYDASYEIIGNDSAMIKVTVEGVSFNFVKVEGGKMNLGQLGVCELNTFWLMETEVTNEIASLFYEDIYTENVYNVRGARVDLKYAFSKAYTEQEKLLCPFIIYSDFSWYPKSNLYAKEVYTYLVYVIPNALNSLLPSISFSLPSTKQWTYAARGGNKSKHYLYSGSNNQDEVAWYVDNSVYVDPYGAIYLLPHLVKQKKANELGLYDMSGNVCEFTDDDVIMGAEMMTEFIEYSFTAGNAWFDRSKWYKDSMGKVFCGGGYNSYNCYPAMSQRAEYIEGVRSGSKTVTPTGLRIALIPR